MIVMIVTFTRPLRFRFVRRRGRHHEDHPAQA